MLRSLCELSDVSMRRAVSGWWLTLGENCSAHACDDDKLKKMHVYQGCEYSLQVSVFYLVSLRACLSSTSLSFSRSILYIQLRAEVRAPKETSPGQELHIAQS